MSYRIDIQHASDEAIPVSDYLLRKWAKLALKGQQDSGELTLRLVNPSDMIELNHQYRAINKETNVLAFPSHIPTNIQLKYPLLGDVIICPAVLKKESELAEKPLRQHWAHIVLHGILHLLGYDHIQDEDAKVMQALEIQLLAELKFANPYQIEDNDFE